MQSKNLNLPVKLPVSSSKLIKKLDEWRIVYKHFTHEPLMTVKESKSIQEKLFGKTKGKGHIKNLYLRDKRKNNILLVTHQDTVVNLKSLAEKIKMQRLSFGSPDRLMENLGVLPGAVSPFAMINGVKKNVNLFLDINLSSFKKIFAHPLENNQTVEISIDQLENFFKKISATPNWISLENKNK